MSSFPVLWLRDDDLDALELMTEIMKRLKEREQKQLKETVIINKFIGYIKELKAALKAAQFLHALKVYMT